MPPTRGLGPGLEWRAAIDVDWTLDPAVVDGWQCRRGGWRGRTRCPNPAVAALMRPTYRYLDPMDLSGRRRVPWRYCGAHLYGRWVEDGTVMGWVVRRVGEP